MEGDPKVSRLEVMQEANFVTDNQDCQPPQRQAACTPAPPRQNAKLHTCQNHMGAPALFRVGVL